MIINLTKLVQHIELSFVENLLANFVCLPGCCDGDEPQEIMLATLELGIQKLHFRINSKTSSFGADIQINPASEAVVFVMLCYVMLCYVMLCYVMLCYVMLCYVMLCYVMLCYVMLCYVMLCYVMLCYVMLCYVMCT